MKGGGALLALILAAGCTTVQHNSDVRMSNEKYAQLVEIIKKQKEREPFKQVPESTLEEKIEEKVEQNNIVKAQKNEQTNVSIIYSDSIYDFLRLNYGRTTVDALSLSDKYAEVMTGLASIPKFQEVIPALMNGLKLQIERSYRGKLRDELPSTESQFTLLALIPNIQHNAPLAELLLDLNSKGVSLDLTPAQESLYKNHILPNIFLRAEDWLNSRGEKPTLEFSAQKFLEEIVSRSDLKDFVEHPNKLDAQIEEWLSNKKHHVQSLGVFDDGYEDWQNYKHLDLVQKLQLYVLIDELNRGNLRKESFDLRDVDLMLEYTEVGGEIELLEDGLHFTQVESTAQRFYPEKNVPLMRIAGLTQDLDEEQRVQIYERKEWLTEEQASHLSEEQKEMILEKYAENRNARSNIGYSSDYSKGIGNFHFHSEIMRSSQVAGPTGWLTETPFSVDGHLKIGGDLAAAAEYLDYRGKHFMNVVVTSIDKDKVDVNLYYSFGANGKPVNVSVGEFGK